MPEGSDIGDSRLGVSLAEWSVSGYDEAIVSLDFMVGSINFDLKIAPQTLCFSITSKPKSIETRSVRREQSGFLQTAVSKANSSGPI